VRSTLRTYGLPLLLLAATAVTITANGARFMENFRHGLPPVAQDSDLWPWEWLSRHPRMLLSGWVFSAPLLGILLIHEFGHYFACRWHRISASLPWLLPAPTLSGTAGAVIRIRSRIPNRNALMDVGVYGPIPGYVASLLAVGVGFWLSVPAPANAQEAIVRFGGEPLTLHIVHALLAVWRPDIPSFQQLTPHPALLAGWIGLLITSLNLLPGGQLDGGHILYAFSPRLHRISTRILPVLLLVAGVFCWAGWVLWGLILLLPAMRHPPLPIGVALGRWRALLGLIALAILVLTFTPTPFYDNSLLDFIRAF
jgi:membrane-associated protease RseP (regulator of RpoE activity)